MIKLSESSTVSDSSLLSYQKIRNKPEKGYDYIIDGIILRSKARWYEQGEKCTKYFLSLEKDIKPSLVSEKENMKLKIQLNSK